jgi:PAS domain S-box-containing protein
MRTARGKPRQKPSDEEIPHLAERRLSDRVIADVAEQTRAEPAIERENAQAELERSRLRAIMDLLPYAVWFRGQDGELLDYNAGYLDLVGDGAPIADVLDHMANDPVFDALTGERFTRETLPGSRVARGGEAVSGVELFIDSLGGRRKRVLVSCAAIRDGAGKPVGAVGSAVDISELVSLRRSEERFAKAFRASPAVIAITRKRDGLFLEVNGAIQKMLLYAPEELVGRTTAELDIWARTEDREAVIRALDNPGWIRDAEYLFRRKDGEVVVSSYSAELVEIGGEECILAIVNDVTAGKRAEGELRQAREELESRVLERTRQLAEANAELEAFSYSVSHDLRAPLRTLDGFSKILLDDFPGDFNDDARDLLARMRAAAVRMGDMIDGMLRLSRLARTELRLVEVDLSEMAQGVARELRETAPERHVQFHIAPDLKAVGDPDLLTSLLQNLLGNAWKFTSKHDAASIEVGSTRRAGRSCFFVRDDGVGFDSAYSKELFAPFQRLHPQAEYGGTGIGLSTAQRIVHRHGGEIWAESEVGKGATFYFSLAAPPSV